MDPEMAGYVERHLVKNGVNLVLNANVCEFRQTPQGALEVLTQEGQIVGADLVVLGIGVRPETWLAKQGGLEIGERGGIRVDDHMRTSVPDIFAGGDAVEVKDYLTGEWSLVALAGPANRQGRIAADVIAGRNARHRGTQGTAIIGLFGAAAAWTGMSEKMLNRIGEMDYEKIDLYPNSHAGYYPGAKYLAMKILFSKSDGRILGAQAVGQDGVDKRIDAIAMAIQLAQPSTTWKRPSCAMRRSLAAPSRRSTLPGWWAPTSCAGTCRSATGIVQTASLLLDVRQPAELALEEVPGAINIPLDQLRRRFAELPRRAAKFSSSAARASAPITPPASCCRQASTPRTFRGGCWHISKRMRDSAVIPRKDLTMSAAS